MALGSTALNFLEPGLYREMGWTQHPSKLPPPPVPKSLFCPCGILCSFCLELSFLLTHCSQVRGSRWALRTSLVVQWLKVHLPR